MKVLKICFVFEDEQWDEARELLTEEEVRQALLVGGANELTRIVQTLQQHEHEEILEERDE